MSPARSSSPSRAARLGLAALAGGAALVAPGRAECQTASAYLEKLAQSSRATYQSRQLVVNLGFPQSAAVLEVRATPAGTFVRAETASDVTRVWRDPGHALVSDRRLAMEDRSAPIVPFSVRDVIDKYDVRVGVRSIVLGVTVVPLDLVRRGDRRLVERLWLNPDNGIVYRRELFGDGGRLVGMSTMLEMRWGHAEGAEPYGGARPARVRATAASGAPKRLPYGYRFQSAYRLEVKGHPAAQWVYSDGLHSLSVFKMRGTMGRPGDYRSVGLAGARAWVGPGPGTWMWEGGRSMWTVVAEESQLDPARITKPFPRGGPSVVSRMGSWWAKAFHWVADRLG